MPHTRGTRHSQHGRGIRARQGQHAAALSRRHRAADNQDARPDWRARMNQQSVGEHPGACRCRQCRRRRTRFGQQWAHSVQRIAWGRRAGGTVHHHGKGIAPRRHDDVINTHGPPTTRDTHPAADGVPRGQGGKSQPPCLTRLHLLQNNHEFTSEVQDGKEGEQPDHDQRGTTVILGTNAQKHPTQEGTPHDHEQRDP